MAAVPCDVRSWRQLLEIGVSQSWQPGRDEDRLGRPGGAFSAATACGNNGDIEHLEGSLGACQGARLNGRSQLCCSRGFRNHCWHAIPASTATACDLQCRCKLRRSMPCMLHTSIAANSITCNAHQVTTQTGLFKVVSDLYQRSLPIMQLHAPSSS